MNRSVIIQMAFYCRHKERSVIIDQISNTYDYIRAAQFGEIFYLISQYCDINTNINGFIS